MIDADDNLNGVLKDSKSGEGRLTTEVRAKLVTEPGIFTNTYEPNTNTLVLNEAFNEGAIMKSVDLNGRQVPMSLFVLIRHMKKMRIPEGSLTKLKHSKVINDKTVFDIHKKAKELGFADDQSKLPAEVVLETFFVKLDKKFIGKLDYEIINARIDNKNGDIFHYQDHVHLDDVDEALFSKNQLDKAGIGLEEEIWVGFDIIVEIKALK